MNVTRRQSLKTLTLAAILAFAVPYALAHAHPKVMVPAADSTVTSPKAVSITFSEALEPKFSSINVVDEKGKKYNTAASQPLPTDPKTLTLALPSLPPGGYLVRWVSVAADGHRLEGEYKFTVK